MSHFESTRRSWPLEDSPLIPLPAAALEGVSIPAESAAFLLNVGLPRSSPPYLDFGPFSASPLPRLSDLVASVLSSAAVACLAGFRVIGGDGSEAHICIAESSGAVVLVNALEGAPPQLLNSSAMQLVQSLAAFNVLVDDVVGAHGVFRPSRVSDAQAVHFAETIQDVDEPAIARGTFWRAVYGSLGQR